MRKIIKQIPIVRTVAYILFTFNKKGLLNPIKLFKTIRYLPTYLKDLRAFRKSEQDLNYKIKTKEMFPVFVDYSQIWINKHYWFQDIYIASKIIDMSRKEHNHKHIDIGSRVEGFITSLISAKVNLVFGDINLPKVPFPNVEAKFIDLQAMSKEEFIGVKSVSSLHVMEHLGLGKYGDKIDAIGHKRIFEDFSEVLEKGTKLYLSSPISNKSGVIFNAGRHLDPFEMIDDAKKNNFEIDEMAVVQDDWCFDINPNEEQLKKSEYGCLILCMTKK